jgi:hypothetical protein
VKHVRQFRQETLLSVADASSKSGKYQVLIGGKLVCKADKEKDALYIRKNLRRFFRRLFGVSPRFAIKKV